MQSTEIVKALNGIESAIYTSGFIIWLSIFFLMVISWRLIRTMREVKGMKALSFNCLNAENLYNSAKYNELLKYCDDMERQYPNDVNVCWYQALVYYQTGELELSNNKFRKVVDINPHYKESAQPYVDEIFRLLNQSNSVGSH